MLLIATRTIARKNRVGFSASGDVWVWPGIGERKRIVWNLSITDPISQQEKAEIPFSLAMLSAEHGILRDPFGIFPDLIFFLLLAADIGE